MEEEGDDDTINDSALSVARQAGYLLPRRDTELVNRCFAASYEHTAYENKVPVEKYIVAWVFEKGTVH